MAGGVAMNDMSLVKQPEECFYLVVRTYRNKRSVKFISSDRAQAETAFHKTLAKLRDGDLALWRSLPTVLAKASGGYNRTRW